MFLDDGMVLSPTCGVDVVAGVAAKIGCGVTSGSAKLGCSSVESRYVKSKPASRRIYTLSKFCI
jgi:hypothetical protein